MAVTQLRTVYIREMVRRFMEDHLGCTPKEIVFATGLTIGQVMAARRAIRNEWTGGLAKTSAVDTHDAIRKGMARIQSGYGLIGGES
jgi:hypothetical protein